MDDDDDDDDDGSADHGDDEYRDQGFYAASRVCVPLITRTTTAAETASFQSRLISVICLFNGTRRWPIHAHLTKSLAFNNITSLLADHHRRRPITQHRSDRRLRSSKIINTTQNGDFFLNPRQGPADVLIQYRPLIRRS
jgi:hypothetical protein